MAWRASVHAILVLFIREGRPCPLPPFPLRCVFFLQLRSGVVVVPVLLVISVKLHGVFGGFSLGSPAPAVPLCSWGNSFASRWYDALRSRVRDKGSLSGCGDGDVFGSCPVRWEHMTPRSGGLPNRADCLELLLTPSCGLGVSSGALYRFVVFLCSLFL
jgi:hypothetical protein